MYKEFRKELMSWVLEYDIINIYFFNGNKIKKIIIGQGGLEPKDIEFKSLGLVIKSGPISSIWYSYASIQQIEVFG